MLWLRFLKESTDCQRRCFVFLVHCMLCLLVKKSSKGKKQATQSKERERRWSRIKHHFFFLHWQTEMADWDDNPRFKIRHEERQKSVIRLPWQRDCIAWHAWKEDCSPNEERKEARYTPAVPHTHLSLSLKTENQDGRRQGSKKRLVNRTDSLYGIWMKDELGWKIPNAIPSDSEINSREERKAEERSRTEWIEEEKERRRQEEAWSNWSSSKISIHQKRKKKETFSWGTSRPCRSREEKAKNVYKFIQTRIGILHEMSQEGRERERERERWQNLFIFCNPCFFLIANITLSLSRCLAFCFFHFVFLRDLLSHGSSIFSCPLFYLLLWKEKEENPAMKTLHCIPRRRGKGMTQRRLTWGEKGWNLS